MFKARSQYVVRLVAIVAGVAVGLIFVLLLFPWAKEAARVSSCTGHLYKLSLALGDYYREKHAFPPQNGAGDDGDPATWIDLMRPHLGGAYYRVDRATYLRDFFKCPSSASTRPDYLHVAGPGALSDGKKYLSASQIDDGIENTLAIIEAPGFDGPNVDNAEIQISDLGKLAGPDGNIPATTVHSAGRGLLFADGLIFRQVKPLPVEVMKALMTANGREDVSRSRLVAEGYLVPHGGFALIPGS